MLLADTNLTLRSRQPSHALHGKAVDALAELAARGEVVCLVPQVLQEFWTVCTRPVAVNGWGLSPADAALELAALESEFPLLRDAAVVYDHWRDLVTRYGVSGKPAHDARLVAAMIAHGLPTVLTFNPSDFRRYTEITVLTPDEVLNPVP